jgi:hypothetical protein
MGITPYWQDHIERWQASGLTAAVYCQQAGLNPRTLSARWSDYRRQRPQEAILVPVELTGSKMQPGTGDEVALTVGETKGVAPTLVLHCRQGHRVELPISISAVWLATLLKGLS